MILNDQKRLLSSKSQKTSLNQIRSSIVPDEEIILGKIHDASFTLDSIIISTSWKLIYVTH